MSEGEKSKPNLVPPDGHAPIPSKRNRLPALLIAGLLCILLVIAVGVAFLPQQKAKSPVATPAGMQSVETVADPDDASIGEAKKALRDWLALKSRAETGNIAQWGDARYEELTVLADSAEQLFAKRLYAEAAGQYKRATTLLQELYADKESLVKEKTDLAKRALQEKKFDQAVTLLQQVLFIDPNNSGAKQGILQAQTSEDVFRLYGQGQEEEKDGNLEAALQHYEKALHLDPQFTQGNAARNRIQHVLQEKKFQEHIGQGLFALEKGNLQAAGAALDKASHIFPHDPAVLDDQKRLEDQKLRLYLRTMKQKGSELHQAEKWQDAVTLYEAVLARVPDSGFALVGREKAKQRLDLDLAMQKVIDRPERLQDDAVRAFAQQTLQKSQQISMPGSRLQKQMATVTRLVKTAETPVTVEIRSDNMTEVTLFHGGKFGRFSQKTLQLKPGKYTFLGTRPGYRDVRMTVVVEAAATTGIDIRCKEPI